VAYSRYSVWAVGRSYGRSVMIADRRAGMRRLLRYVARCRYAACVGSAKRITDWPRCRKAGEDRLRLDQMGLVEDKKQA